MVDAAVIICTHNPRLHYLHRVLAALRNQTLPMEQWELLVIDNASQERLTSDILDLSWHPHAQIVREEELGLSAARMRGMREAAADLLVFVDDDNLLGPDYCAGALRIARQWPQLGVWGGSIVPEFELQPPEYLREFFGYLALREIKTPFWSNVMTCSDARPLGAGLCVRINVAEAYRIQYKQEAIQLSDRRGKSLLGGGDLEICYVACSLGFGMGLFPELKVTHLIPRERLDKDYLLRLYEASQTSASLLAYKWLGVLPRSIFTGVGLLRFCKDILLHRGIQRRMYLASLRASVAARKIILSTGTSCLS